jgi:hypothetical protein
MKGFLQKMRYIAGDPLKITLCLGNEKFSINDNLGKNIEIKYSGFISCCNCHGQTKKSYGGGYCYLCYKRLAECDMCILKPETCHRAAGTCRSNTWSDNNCMQSHIVYLAYTSEVKVGITRSKTGLPRWYDQGAICAIPLVIVPDRLAAGELEVFLAKEFSDKTNWKKMLENNVNIATAKNELLIAYKKAKDLISGWLLQHQFVRLHSNDNITEFNYPMLPSIKLNLERRSFDKEKSIAGELLGVRGQYLLLSSGIINIRQHSGYEVEIG